MVYSTEPDPLRQIFDMVAGNTGVVTAPQLEKVVAEFREKLQYLPVEQSLQMSGVITELEGVLQKMSVAGLDKVDYVKFLEFAPGFASTHPGAPPGGAPGPSYVPAAAAPTNSKKSGGAGTLFVLAALAVVVYSMK
jgi:hypothetical protein